MPAIRDKHGGVRMATEEEVVAGLCGGSCRVPHTPVLLPQESKERQLPAVEEKAA